MKPISRASGRSAVASAAYRAGESLTNERDGLTHDFTRRHGVEHCEIVVAQGTDAEWALDRSALWNAAEESESRKDARVAREFEIALPHELNAEQRLELTREFAQGLADRHGTAVDFAIHAPHGSSTDQVRGDGRNFHAHLMMTTRAVNSEGLGDKTAIERENKWLAANNQPLTQVQLVEIRQSWEQTANEHLARAGLEVQIDHRSHMERGLEIEPTEHMGVHATQMQRRGLQVSRTRLDSEAARRNAELIREKPEQVLSIVTGEKSVFDRRDVARALHRYIDQPEDFQGAFARAMGSKALVELAPEVRAASGEVLEAARYSTREMVEIERGMVFSADRLSEARGHGVGESHVEEALASRSYLSDEQQEAVRHVTGEEQLAVVVGLAGAGKSTMLSAAREAWEREGYRVHGAALSGKAAEGLEESSGIASRTLASWDYGWQAGRGELGSRDILVIDEAGMVSSKQLARFIGEAERTGAKIVLVGDPEQLQPIQAGAAFRAVAERVGFAELEGVRRQGENWQRQASQDLARHRTSEGLEAYAERDGVRFAETRGEARGEIVRDVLKDMSERPDGSRIVLAHRRADVRELNGAIRAARQESGELPRGDEAGERVYQTNDGERRFAPGDRVLFLENNRDLGVKNGMLGTVQEAEEGRLVARLDTAQGAALGREVSVSTADYAAIDHGYATTIHKSQGATVDRAYVLSSGSMDRHLTYVAMTRHREEARLYAGRDEFGNLQGLSERLGRAGLKETTLDYARDFAEQRGLADRLGVSSEIVVPGRAESDAQRAKESDREGAARPSELSAEGDARETQPRAAPDREKLRAYGEAAKAAFARSREVAADGAEERQDERAQTSAPREAQERERQQASPSLDAERMQAIAQEAKLAFYKAEGAAKAREAFAQGEARRAMEAERVRAEAERQRLAEEQLLKEQNRERQVMRQRSQSHGHER
jgi:Ti-type conjugative transfer relaxase TraA